MTKYNLTSKEKTQLRKACKYMNLQYTAMAARQNVARDILKQYAQIMSAA